MIRKVVAVAVSVLIVLTASLVPPASVFAQPPDGYDRDDFARIAEGGFGDPMNNYAFSMAEFKGDLYVGTNRNFLFRVLEVLLPGYEFQYVTVPSGDPWSPERAWDMCAEIWRYHNGDWRRVYQSQPEDVSFLGPLLGMGSLPPGTLWAAKEPGFREMITFTDKWGEEAVYAASGVSLVPGRLLLKSTDGTTWEEVVTPPAMGSDSRSMAVHNGKLYVGPATFAANAAVWATDDPSTTSDNWTQVADFTAEVPGTNVAVVSMASFNGYLYAGTQNDEAGFQVWRSNAQSPDDPPLDGWTKIVDYGAGDMANTRALTMAVFKDRLYVGSSMFPLSPEPPYFLLPKGCELIRIDTDDSWELLVGDYFAQKPPAGPTLRLPISGWPGGFGNFLNLYCWSLEEDDGVLYLGTFDASSFLQLLPEEFLDLFPELTPTEQEQIVSALEDVISLLEGLGVDEVYIEPFRTLREAFLPTDQPVNWEEVWQVFIDYFAGADLWKTEDGIVWEPVSLNGFDNPDNYGVREMVSGTLYIGTANPFGGLEVWSAPREKVVGGTVLPVDKLSILMPWIGLAVALALAGVFITRFARRKVRG